MWLILEKQQGCVNNMNKRQGIILASLFLLLGTLILVIFATQKPQELRQKAATPTGPVELIVSPSTSIVTGGTPASISLSVNIPTQTNIDGFQIIANLSGNIPMLNYEQPTLPGMTLLKYGLTGTSDTKQLSIVYISDDPLKPYIGQGLISLGKIKFPAPTSGSLTLSFNTTLTKIAENQTTKDIVRVPSPITYTFVPPTVKVLFPNGGEILSSGQFERINWDMSEGLQYVNIYLVNSLGASTSIAKINAPIKTYEWTVPVVTVSGQYKIAAVGGPWTGMGAAPQDESDGFFKINPLIPTNTPTPIPINTPTIKPTIKPTLSPTPTKKPTVTPTRYIPPPTATRYIPKPTATKYIPRPTLIPPRRPTPPPPRRCIWQWPWRPFPCIIYAM